MKIIKSIFLLFILVLFTANDSYSEPVKRALIIAIGNYPPETGFGNINSLNDVPLIKTSLQNQGFPDMNIKVLIDAQATREGIINALDELLNSSNQGDIVVIHYSGHGQQMQDSIGNKPEGIDEALVSYNAKLLPTQTYYGQNHIRDHLISEYIKKFRLKLGQSGLLNLFIDACFSGNMTKGINESRSNAVIFGTPEFLEKYYKGNTSNKNGLGIYDCIKELSDKSEIDKMSGFVFFAPCMFNQPCYEIQKEGKWIGPLSFGISKAFATIKPNETYRQLFAKIYAAIKANSSENQDPQAEGNLDNVVFSGLINSSKPYYSVIDRTVDDELIINGGEFSGIYKNTVVGFYPGETHDPAGIEPTFETKITNVRNFNSSCKINDKSFGYEELLKMRIFVLKQGLPEKDLKIKFMGLDANIISALTVQLKSVEYISITDSYADYLLTENNPGTNIKDGKLYILSGINGSSCAEPFDLSDGNYTYNIVEKLKDLFVYNLLRDIELNDKNYGVNLDVKLINWINIAKKEAGSPLNEISGVKNSNKGDTIMITITNTGSSDAYISLINFDPDGKIKQFIPYENNSKPNLLPKGNVINIPFKSSRSGLEIYKVFATKEPVNFNPIIRSRGLDKSEKGSKNPLEELLLNGYSGLKGVQQNFSGGTTNALFIKVTE